MAGEIEQIKQRLDIVDVIGEYVHLKQTGNSWRALCPFHTEKTPSFHVSRDRQGWHCFGCSEGGDMFTFIQKIEGVEFIDALRQLAKKAGIELQRQDPKEASQRSRLLDICLMTADYWHRTLLESPVALHARQYLTKRGLSDKTIEDFKIGYAKDSWDDLILFLKGKGFTDEEIFLAGLSVKKDRGVGFYDRFRERVMFPINDLQGNPIGFTGRTLEGVRGKGEGESVSAKYINTPQTKLYNKSVVVFNLDKAKSAIREADLAVLVEGQMDVIASVQAGVRNVVAVSGTALTAEQVQLLKRYASSIAISLDADAAGRKAVARSTELVQDMSSGKVEAPDARGRITTYFDPAAGLEMNLSVIVLPFGKDPDECIHHDPKLWLQAIADARPVMDYFFERTASDFDLSAAPGKKQAAAFLLRHISRLVNRVEQAHWIQKLAGLLNVPEQVLWDTLTHTAGRPVAVAPKPQPSSLARDRGSLMAEHVLSVGLAFPAVLSELVEGLELDQVPDGPTRSLYNRLKSYYNQTCQTDGLPFEFQHFHAALADPILQALADRLVVQAEKEFFNFEEGQIRTEVRTGVRALQRSWYSRRLAELAGNIRQAEAAGNQDMIGPLAEEFSQTIRKSQELS